MADSADRSTRDTLLAKAKQYRLLATMAPTADVREELNQMAAVRDRGRT